jgi:hypothetical protein
MQLPWARHSIREWAENFVKFIEGRQDLGDDAAQQYVQQVANEELIFLKKEVVGRFWQNPKALNKNANATIPSILVNIVAERRRSLDNLGIAKSLVNISVDDILNEYGNVLTSIITKQLEPITVNEDISKSISVLIISALLVSKPSQFSTGLIIAGYGHDDTYPSVAPIDIDGYLSGRLKYSEINERAKIVKPELGYAVSFAQTDVIERLLSGVDPRFIDKTYDFLIEVADKLAPVLVTAVVPRAKGTKRSHYEKCIKEILNIIPDTYVNDTSISFRAEFREEFERMIALMPKLELIELAEAIISITAIERKATSAEGTVGGPIDVAFITKHEGFVWIKRKHYFEAHLNPRYFWRKFQRLERLQP